MTGSIRLNLKYLRDMKGVSFVIFILFSFQAASGQSRAVLERERMQIIEKIDFVTGIPKKNVIDKENTLMYFNSLQLQIQNRDNMLKNIKAQISVLNQEIESSNKLLDSLNYQRNSFRENQAHILRNNYYSTISKNKYLFLFSSKGWDDFLDRSRYIRQYSAFIDTEMGKLREKEKGIKSLLEKINTSKQDLEGLLAAENETLTELNKESEMKMGLLQELKNNETKYKAILRDRQKEREELNKNIEDIIFSHLRANLSAEWPVSDATISENIADHRSNLSWPVSNGYIYSQFGRHDYPGMPGVFTNNSGIDIATNPFEEVKAVFDGEVAGLMHISGYNWMVIIKHGEHYSVYSKLETVNISKGELVKKNQIIGKIGRNGEFHFEIWHLKTKLNPELWLKKM